MAMMKLLTIITALSFLSACAVAPPTPKVEEEGAINSIANTSDIQMTLIKRHGDPERYCAARQSDVADTRSAGGGLGFSGAGVGDALSEGTSQGALALGGRSPSVLIIREFMYRACELSLNLNATTEQTIEIYKMFIDSAKEISALQTGPGSSVLGQGATSNAPNASESALSENKSSSDNGDGDDNEASMGVD